MKIAFRADASIAIGTGHIMRCLTLADVLRNAGAEVSFVCRKLAGNLGDSIVRAGYAMHYLPEQVRDWQEDAALSGSVFGLLGGDIDWVIVDHYGLDARWESAMRRYAKNIMAIDDLADRRHDCDLLLDQNCYSNSAVRYDRLLPDRCKKLLGPRYALLREEFIDARRNLRRHDGGVRRILLFFGGTDPTNETEKALRAFSGLRRTDLHADVVVGAANSNRQRIESLCRDMPNVSYHCQISNIASLMAEADLALGAGGSATWERCCLGLPGIIIAVADNQIDVAKAAEEAGCILFLGNSAEVSIDYLSQALRRLLEDATGLRTMSSKGMALVDGDGARRVDRALREIPCDGKDAAELTLRYAAQSDERSLYEWRNAPQVRTASFDDRLISWEEHVSWFRAALANPNRILLIGEAGNRAIGVLRYDRDGDDAEVSIYLVPGLAGKGWGVRLLNAGHAWVRNRLPEVRQITARILPDNPASHKAFARAGYLPRGATYVFDMQSCS